MTAHSPITSTMQDDFQLTITAILRHGATVHGRSECVTWLGDRGLHVSYAEIARNAERLAAALAAFGIRASDRVGTFCWNNQAHLEAYYAVPCMGAVLHTINIRLPAGQVTVVLRFATKAAATAWYESSEYRAIKHLRTDNTEGIAVIAEGK